MATKDQTKKTQAGPQPFAFFDTDFTKYAAQFKFPGVDFEALTKAHQRNFEALAEANKLALEGFQAVARRQAQILQDTVEEARTALTTALTEGKAEDKAAKQAEYLHAAFEQALANMKELAELVQKSNSEAADVINSRVSEGLKELKGAIKKAAA